MSTEISVAELLQKIDAGEPILLLDVRNDEDFERWRVEGRKPVDTMHRPYFDFIEDESLLHAVPRGRDIFAICAKGGSSEAVAEMLRDRGIPASNVAGGMEAYGQHLQPERVPLDPDEEGRFEIWQLNRRGKGCLSYVVRSGREAVVIDPSRNIRQYEEFADHVVAVLDTHVHADHISGGPALASHHQAKYFGAGSDGEEIRAGDVTIRILSTPGHTPGSMSFLVGNHLLTGDTLFVASVGRPDLGGQVVEWGKMLFHTLKDKISKLPDHTVILPAHYAATSEIGPDGVVSARLGDLRRSVPELRIGSEPEFVEAMKKSVTTPPPVYEKIVQVNLGLQKIEAETATEWELGKNECAASRRAMEVIS